LPTKWFLILVLAAVLAGGLLAARGPQPEPIPGGRGPKSDRSAAPSPARPVAPSEPFVPAGTPASGRFRLLDLTGQAAPDFRLQDMDGRWHTLNEHRGKVVMLVFWTTWCQTCPIELPHLAYITQALTPRGLVTLSINWEKDPGPVRKMARETRFDAPVLSDRDQKTRYDYDVWSVPRVVIVDRSGRIARIIRGYEGEAGPIVKALADQGLALPGLEAILQPVPVERVPVEDNSLHSTKSPRPEPAPLAP
jgi:peroxiredoxin